MTREEAIEKIKFLSDHSCNYYLGRENEIALDMALEALKQPEQKKGYWIGRPIAGYATVRCSVCKDVFCENAGRWKFCPHCGAKMEGEE